MGGTSGRSAPRPQRTPPGRAAHGEKESQHQRLQAGGRAAGRDGSGSQPSAPPRGAEDALELFRMAAPVVRGSIERSDAAGAVLAYHDWMAFWVVEQGKSKRALVGRSKGETRPFG